MIAHFYYILKLIRPRQWIKNFALFAAIIFGGRLPIGPIFGQASQVLSFDPFFKVILGFVSFCLLSSATYIINDILDARKDRLHPFKRHRPIASHIISVPEAWVLFLIFVTVAFFIAIKVGMLFFTVTLVYILLQVLYSFIFKAISIFDILFIAAGYILRVFAGELISGYHISVWLLLTTISLSLFLAVGKRRSELTLLRNVRDGRIDEVRKTLSHYSDNLLDVFSTLFATSTFIFYSVFTFNENPAGTRITANLLLPDFLPSSLQRKWLMITILPVVYGLMRYMQDIYEKSEGESPDRVLTNDKPLLINFFIWIFLVVFIIYFMQEPY